MLSGYWIILTILAVVAVASVLTEKLTRTAAITGWVVGWIVFAGFGYVGVIMIAAFFILGTLATSWKLNIKQQLLLAEDNKGRRTAGQVLANAGVITLLACIVLLSPSYFEVLKLMAAASLASATSDTLSSELGNVYGKNFYNILSFKKDSRGLNGVISLEGTLAGIAGSAVIALIYCLAYGFTLHFIWIIIAGTAGNFFDSVLGASLERKRFLNNNWVNFLNTLFAALVIAVLHLIDR